MTENTEAGAVGPVRVQLRRTKGWRMPPNTVKVTRPGKLGNPLTMANAIEAGFATKDTAHAFVVEAFEDWLSGGRDGRDWWNGPKSDAARSAIIAALPLLRGKNLACWCKLDQPCHADVLLRAANGEWMGWEIGSVYPNGNVSWVKRERRMFGDTGIPGNFHTYHTLPPGEHPSAKRTTAPQESAPVASNEGP